MLIQNNSIQPIVVLYLSKNYQIIKITMIFNILIIFKYYNQMTLIVFLLCASLIQLTYTYNQCASKIQFDQYTFDIRTIPDQSLSIYGQSKLVKIFPCKPKSCISFGYNTTQPSDKTSFVLLTQGNKCSSFAINQSIVSNFDYIQSSKPDAGIKIDYLPYITKLSGVDSNNISYKNVSIHSSFLNIWCNSAATNNDNCTIKQQTTNTSIDGIIVNLIQTNITCNIWRSEGCPAVSINNFWQFLIDSKILFSIIIWILSFFLLFFSYFVIRLTILIYGLLTGSVLGIVISAQNYTNFFYDDHGNGITIFIILLSLVMGFVFGLSLLTLPKLGYMNIGLWNAIIFTLLLQNSVLYMSGSMTAFYITLGVVSLIMMAISLLGFRKFIIVSTSFISSFWIIRSLGFVLPYYPNQFSASKYFVINQSNPWQFYLYLVSIIILTILGCTFQFHWYKKKGRDHANKNYYLQDDDNIKDKLKKLLQFKDVKELIKAGTSQVMFLKNLVSKKDDQQNQKPLIPSKDKYIQMKNMKKQIQNKKSSQIKPNRQQQSSQEQYPTKPVFIAKSNKKVFSSGSQKDIQSKQQKKNSQINNKSNKSSKIQYSLMKNQVEEDSDQQVEIKKIKKGSKKF